MKINQKDSVIYSVFIYFVLILLTFLLRDKPNFKNVCSYSDACVRFCCDDLENCNDKFIKKHFNASLLPHPWYVVEEEATKSPDYRILYGKPTCKLEMNPSERSWKFLTHGGIQMEDFYHDTSEYCFQDISIDDGSNIGWNLFTCSSTARTQWIVHCVFMSISVVLLATAICLYAFNKPLLADNHGKISICFLIGAFFTMLAIPLNRIQMLIYLQIINFSLFIGGFVFMLLWISAECFDIWYNFKSLRSASDGTDRFKYYAYYVFGVLAFLLLVVLITIFEIPGIIEYIWLLVLIVAFLFIAMTIAIITFLVLVGIKVFRMSKASNHSEHLWLEEEKTRFWSCIQIFGIFLVVAPFELLIESSHYESLIVTDAIKLFSTFLLFAIFVLKDKPRKTIFKQYDVLVNVPL